MRTPEQEWVLAKLRRAHEYVLATDVGLDVHAHVENGQTFVIQPSGAYVDAGPSFSVAR